MPFLPDGSWKSPKSGKVYDKDAPRSQMSDEDNAALSEELKNEKLTASNPVGDGTTQSAPFAAPDITGMPGSSLDTKQSDKARGDTAPLIASLQQQATTGDGAWRQQFAESIKRSKDAASALGSSMPGTDYGSALRGINAAQTSVDQRAVGDADVLKAQSQLDARNRLGDVLGNQARGDLLQASDRSRVAGGVRSTQAALQDRDARENTMGFLSALGQGVGVVGGGVGAAAKTGAMSEGGRVPGRAAVFGNDERNDTVPAWLSPGEIVVDKEHTATPEMAARRAFEIALHKTRGGAASRDAAGATAMAGGGFLGGPDRQSPSVENGGLLDDAQYQETALRQRQLGELFSGQAAGNGPSIATPALQRSTDEYIGAAGAAGRAGMPSGAALQRAGEAGEEAGAGSARQRAAEQSHGQGALAQALGQRRAQEMQLASSNQEAAWKNSMLNAGVSLKDQALIRQAVGGAGQGLASYASLGGGGGSGGYTANPNNLTSLSDNPYPEPTDWNSYQPEEDQGSDLKSGMSEGGVVHDSDAEYDEEVGGPRPVKRIKAEPRESAFKRALKTVQQYAQQAGASVSRPGTGGSAAGAGATATGPERLKRHAIEGNDEDFEIQRAFGGAIPGYAEGGGIDALFSRRDDGPVAVDRNGAPLQSLPPTYVDPSLFMLNNAPLPPAAAVEPAFDPLPTDHYPPPAGGYSSGVPMTSTEQDISDHMSKPRAPARLDAEKSQKDRSDREALGIRPGSAPPPAASLPAELPGVPAVPSASAQAPKAGGTGTPSFGAKADEASKRAAQESYTAAQATNAATVNAAAAEASAIESQVNERKALAAKVQESVGQAKSRFEQAQQEMARIDTTVDPGRFWATRNTGDRIIGILGLALGALGAGPDGVNRAAVMLNQAIDRDLEAQKAQHELQLRKGAARVDAAKSFYSMAREASGDELGAMDLAHAAALNAVSARGKEMMAKTLNPQAKAQLATVLAGVDQGSAQRAMAGWDKSETHKIEREKIQVEREKALLAAGARSNEETRTLHQSEAAAQTSLDLINKLRSDLGATRAIGKTVPGMGTVVTGVAQKVGPLASAMDTDTTALVLQLKELDKLGAISGTDKELLDKMIGDPSAFFALEGSKDAKLAALEQMVNRSIKAQRNASKGVQAR